MKKPEVGITDLTGPTGHLSASASVISFKHIPRWPGTYTSLIRLTFGRLYNLNALTAVASEDEVSDVHSVSESVTITIVR